MADKYVTQAAGGGGAGTVGDPWTLTEAFTNAVAGDYVWVKDDATYTNTYSPACTGVWNSNTHIYFIGYHNIANCDLTNHISDMDIGQALWGGPLNTSLANAWVDLDAGAAAMQHLLYLNARQNLHFRNFYLHNTDAGKYDVDANACRGVTFTKCKFADSTYGIRDYYSYGTGLYFCHFGDNITSYQIRAYRAYEKMHVYGCVFNTEAGLSAILSGTGLFEHNVFIGGLRALAMGGSAASPLACIFRSNTCYNQTDYAVLATNDFTEYNNIFVLNDKSDGIISIAANTTVVYSGYSCAWALSNGGEALDSPYAGEYGLNVDPLLVDPATGDFRTRNPALINGGKTDVDGNPSQMGAVQRKYRFAARGRTANRARLQIIR